MLRDRHARPTGKPPEDFMSPRDFVDGLTLNDINRFLVQNGKPAQIVRDDAVISILTLWEA